MFISEYMKRRRKEKHLNGLGFKEDNRYPVDECSNVDGGGGRGGERTSEDEGHCLDHFATMCLFGDSNCIYVGEVCLCSRLLCHITRERTERVEDPVKRSFSQTTEPWCTKMRETSPEYRTKICEPQYPTNKISKIKYISGLSAEERQLLAYHKGILPRPLANCPPCYSLHSSYC